MTSGPSTQTFSTTVGVDGGGVTEDSGGVGSLGVGSLGVGSLGVGSLGVGSLGVGVDSDGIVGVETLGVGVPGGLGSIGQFGS